MQRVQVAVLRCLQQVAACDAPLAIAGVGSSAAEALLPAAGALLAAVGDAMGARQPAPVREQATRVRPAPCSAESAGCALRLRLRPAWLHAASTCVHLVSPHLPHSAPTRRQTYVALARVDPDPAWCQLSAALQAASGAEASAGAQQQQQQQQQQAPQQQQQAPQQWEQPRVAPGMTLQSSGEPLTFPSQQQIAPPLPAAPTPAAASTPGTGRRRGAAAAEAGLSVPPGLRQVSAAKLAAMLRQVEALPPRWHRQVEQLLDRP